ncbi:MAG: hypothetical protein F6K40_02145 [Okeania sp. SIO3I5]|uniref:hypothetical protein n=1 Tax=Okeania sp. SIO3I5 TaxID=2607805 RepID=UPI0013BBFFA6|nr:hypothetical protein [Okeania sp. SIO3I5]NEQ35173.1 hypothetical protein [Okeania sp. SIO3I5]
MKYMCDSLCAGYMLSYNKAELPTNPLSGFKTWVSGGRLIDGQQKFKNLVSQQVFDDKII